MPTFHRALAALFVVRAATQRAGVHEADHATGHAPWLAWGALAALVAGLGLVGAGLYVDHAREERSLYVDGCVLGGLVLAAASMAVFWL